MRPLFLLLTILFGAAANGASGGSIYPGGMVDDGVCTSAFVFEDDAGSLYLGTAAHCFGLEYMGDPCSMPLMPIGTPVKLEGATRPGTLAYSSWTTMQGEGETNATVCHSNDLALVKVHDDDVQRVRPEVLHYGGPTGLRAAEELAVGEPIVSFGSTQLREGDGATLSTGERGRSLGALDAREGYATFHDTQWTTWAAFASPGINGDSGSPVMDAQGHALGILTKGAGMNVFVHLDDVLGYADANGASYRLVLGQTGDGGLLL